MTWKSKRRLKRFHTQIQTQAKLNYVLGQPTSLLHRQ